MNTTLEKIIKTIAAPLGIILAVLALIYGSFLPFRKAQLFIQAMHNSYQARSVADYERIFNTALNFSSPVGQAENIRFLENQIGGVIAQKPPQAIADALVSYADSISRANAPGRYGLNYTQELMTLANIHEVNFRNYRSEKDYNAALALYEKGLALSPKRPQFLYGLYQLYMDAGKTADAKTVGEKIISLWPSDKNMAAFVNGTATSTPAGK